MAATASEPLTPVSAAGDVVSRLTTRQIQRRVRQAALDTYLTQAGTERSLAEFVVDRHGSQLPYDRHLWGNLWRRRRWGDNVEVDLTKEKLDPPLVDALRQSVQRLGECVDEIKTSGRMLERLSFKSFPVDLGDDAVNAWVLSRGTTVDALIEAQGAPPTLNVNNFLEALTEGGILLNAGNPDYEPKPFNLLSPGKSDTRRLHLEIAGKPLHVKRCRTTLAIPMEILPSHVRVPKVGIFEFNANVSLLLFYQGFGKRRGSGDGPVNSRRADVRDEEASYTPAALSRESTQNSTGSELLATATPGHHSNEKSRFDEASSDAVVPGWFLSSRPLSELPHVWGPQAAIGEARAFLYQSGVNDQLYVFIANEAKEVEEGTLLKLAALTRCKELPPDVDRLHRAPDSEPYNPRKRARPSEFGDEL